MMHIASTYHFHIMQVCRACHDLYFAIPTSMDLVTDSDVRDLIVSAMLPGADDDSSDDS
jgi:hypothetical protein